MIETRERKHGLTYRVRRLEGRLTATFRHRDAAELQDALWARWGECIPVLADQRSTVPVDLLLRLTDPGTPELSPVLLGQLVERHPLRRESVPAQSDCPLLGEYICSFFELWKIDKLPGRDIRSVPKRNAAQLEDDLNRLLFKMRYRLDDRGWRVRNGKGQYIADGWGHDALARQPLDQVTTRLLVKLDEEVKRNEVGQEVWRKVLSFLEQLFDQAVIEELVETNPVRLIKKPPQSAKRIVRKAYLPDTLELIRGDFLYLDELAKTRVRGRKVAESPAGVPVPMLPDYGAFSADFVETLGYSGGRPGEVLAAEVDDLEKIHLEVARRAVDGVAVAGTKSTVYPSRSVFLLGPLAETLARRAADAVANGRRLLFPFPGTDRLMTEDEYRRWRARYFAPIAKSHGLGAESDDPYALRHVYASLRIAAHHPLPHIEASMGSGLVGTTYASVFQAYEGRKLNINATIAKARRAAEQRRS